MYRAKQKELKKWEGRSDYDGVILLKSDKRPEYNILDDPENKSMANLNTISGAARFAQAAKLVRDQHNFGNFDNLLYGD